MIPITKDGLLCALFFTNQALSLFKSPDFAFLERPIFEVIKNFFIDIYELDVEVPDANESEESEDEEYKWTEESLSRRLSEAS